MIFDSHAHYDDAAFDADRDELLEAMPAAGVVGIVNAATDLNTAPRSIALAKRYPFVYAAVGIHPEAAKRMDDADAATLRTLAAHPKVVAVGEIGLDYHYPDGCPREVQIVCFERQLQLAQELSLPVVVHDREAHEDTLRLLRQYRPAGVVHCFSGSVEMMQEVVALGMHIGLGGTVTFKNARRPVAVAAAVPLDRLLLETDAPYMAPVPCRGTRCDSRLIAHTAAAIAAIRGISVDELLSVTRANAERLFGIG